MSTSKTIKDSLTPPLPFGFRVQPKVTVTAENGGGQRDLVDKTIWTVYSLLPTNTSTNEQDAAMGKLRFGLHAALDKCGIDFTSFYQCNGAKITRPLKAILESILTKEKVATKFADFCREIGGIYDSFTVEAQFLKPYFKEYDEDKDLDWGDRGSCFRPGGCNEQNGRMIDTSPSMAILTLQPVATEKYGRSRMVVQILNSTTVLLTNKYCEYNKGEIPQNIFVRALEAICRAEIKFKREKHDEEANIFYNNTPLIGRCTAGNFDNLTLDYRLRCVECGTLFTPSSGVTSDDGPVLHVCSQSCHDEARDRGGTHECYECGHRMHEDDLFYANDEHYCDRCYHEHFFRCDFCEEDVRVDDGVAVQSWQNRRGRACYNEETVCEYCADRHFSQCDECGERCDNESIEELGSAVLCKSCIHEVSSICPDCELRFHNDDLDGGLCTTCRRKAEDRECLGCFRVVPDKVA